MSKWNLVYCFSKKLSDNDDNFEKILYSLEKSIEYNSKFHKVKVYTDSLTYQFIEHLNIEIEIYPFSKFRFLDDIKIQTLPLLTENEVLIDPDVFLFKELCLNEDSDAIFERPEKLSDPWYQREYTDSIKFEFSKLIDFSTKSGEVPNIGCIKFFNKDFLDNYISYYNIVRDVADNDKTLTTPFPKFSVLLGQLLLQNVIDKHDYNISYCKFNKKNDYIHLSGIRKYTINGFIDKLTNSKSLI